MHNGDWVAQLENFPMQHFNKIFPNFMIPPFYRLKVTRLVQGRLVPVS